MLLLFKLGLLVSLVRLSVLYDPLGERPAWLAGFYTLGAWVFNAFLPIDRPYWPLWMAVGYLLAWLYFWLLSKIEDAGAVWVIVVMAGVPLVLI